MQIHAPLRMGEENSGVRPRRANLPSRDVSDDAGLRRLVVLAVFFAHVAGWLVVDQLARYRSAALDTGMESSISIAFVTEPSPADEARLPAEPASAREQASAPRAAMRPAPSTDEGVAVQFLPRDRSSETVLDAGRLFTPDGSIRLPNDVAEAAADPFAPSAPVAREPALSHQSTRFDRAWRHDGENLGQQIVRNFPPAMILLQGVHLPECPPDSNHPNCEATAREQRARIPPTPQSGRQPW